MGTLLSSSLSSRVQVIGVCEIDQQALIAVPDLAWHRLKTKRELPEDALLRATRVEVVSASDLDRATPTSTAQKIWLGFLKPELVDAVVFGGPELEAGEIGFPVDCPGDASFSICQSPLRSSSRSFCFCFRRECGPSARTQCGEPLGSLGEQHGRDSVFPERPASAEGVCFRSCSFADQAASLESQDFPESACNHSSSAWPRPQVVQQALSAGVSMEALREIGGVMQAQAAKAAGVKPQDVALAGMSSDEDEKDEHLGVASGVQDPLGQAIVHLSSIVQEMRAEKKQKKDKGLEAILDRAESGSARDTTGSSRSKASALRSLPKASGDRPKAHLPGPEKNLQGDWETGGSNLPGAQITRISARGWLEHRSRISSYPGTIRPAWLCAGIWMR